MILPNPPIHTSKDSSGMQSWFQQLWQKLKLVEGNLPTQVGVQLGTAITTTSGTFHDFTVPSGVRMITISYAGCSTNGTSVPIIQLGDSGGIETTGYAATTSNLGNGSGVTNAFTTGFSLSATGAAANILTGALVLTLLDPTTNLWVAHGVTTFSPSTSSAMNAGSKSLSTELTTARLTTVGGVNTFDAGSVNISYEF